MRGKPKRTERLVGALVLGLLGFIVVAFLLTGGLLAGVVDRVPVLARARDLFGISRRPLFVAAPENMKPPPPPHEMRVAEGLLPEALEPWKRAKGLTCLAHQPVNCAGGFEAAHVYVGRYDGRGASYAVAVSDLGDAEAAFGAWRAMRPAGAKKMAVGRGGWVDPETQGAAFWAGRYVTLLTPVLTDEEHRQDAGATAGAAGQVEGLARAIAGLQINYGGPFWAESVLPAEGRVEDSLAFVRKGGMGIDELTNFWTAEYGGGVTLGVMRAEGSQSAEGALGALRARFAVATQPAGEGKAAGADLIGALGADVASGRVGERAVVAYVSGPYLFVVSGKDIEPMVALAKSTRTAPVGQAAGVATGEMGDAASRGKPEAGRAGGPARFAEVPGGDLQAPVKIERFTDNLYEKIDGREGQFRAYGFVELRFGQYQDTRHQEGYDVYIYDMGQANNAMGIFTAEKSEAAGSLAVGQEGYVSGTSAYFYKGKYYVNVLGPADGDKAEAEVAAKIAAAIAATISDTGGKMWADALLPREGRVGSLRYVTSSALSYDFLERFFFAKYSIGGVELEMFIHKTPGAAEAKALFARYAEEAPKYEKVVSRESEDGGETLVSETAGVFTVAFFKGPYFAGATECNHRELAVKQAAALRASLKADDQGEPAPPRAAPKGKSSEGGGEHGE